MIHHELKTPLTSIKGCAQLMRRRGAYSEWAVEAIIRESDQLRETLDRLLEALYLETDDVDLRLEEIDLTTLTREAADWARGQTSLHAVRLEAPEQPVVGRWDREAIECVLREMLSNAIGYSPRGGEIRLALTADEREVVLSVHDDGVGIAPEETRRVFERFYRAEQPEVHGRQGLGLGLYICHQLVAAHGGRVWARSQPGQGSTFFMALPRQQLTSDA